MAERPIPISGTSRFHLLTAAVLSLLLHGLACAAAMTAAIGHGSPGEIAVPVNLTMAEEPMRFQPQPSALPHPSRSTPRPQTPTRQSHHAVQQPAPHHQVPEPPLANSAAETTSASDTPPSPSLASEPGNVSAASDEPATFQPAAYRLGQPETPIPNYPMSARRRGHEGTVVLRLFLAEDGSSKAVKVIDSSGDAALDAAALETLQRWRLKPALQRGLPVESSIDIPIRFLLQ